MTFPIVSRTAFDTVCDERNWLRGELEKTREHVRRIERVTEGLPELPKKERVADPMPDTLRDKLRGFSGQTLAFVESDALRRRRDGVSWQKIEADITEEWGLE